MSKNFELMQQIQRDRSFRAGPAWDPVFAESTESVSTPDGEGSFLDNILHLVQRVFFLPTQDVPRMVVFAGVDHRVGCSRICAAVAEVLAKNGRGSVCLLEANFRSPALPRLLGTTNHHGLADALRGEDPISSYTKSLGPNKLSLLSSGALAADSASLLTTERIKGRMAELKAAFSFVVIDAPPLSRYGDALAIAQVSDGVVVILEAESTRKEAAKTAIATLRSTKVPVLGAVLNKRVFSIPATLYRRL